MNIARSDRAAFATALVIGGGTALALLVRKLYFQGNQDDNDGSSNMDAYERLMDIEDMLMFGGEPAVSTLTWFRGDHTAAAVILRGRLASIIEANPWLAGTVVKYKGKNHLKYDPGSSTAEGLFFSLSPAELPFARDTPIGALGKLASSLTVPIERNKPLFRLSIVPCKTSPATHFGVAVSMSHVAGDGHTFYAIYNMIMGSKKVRALNVKWIATSTKQQEAALGKENAGVVRSVTFILPALAGIIFGRFMGLFFDSYRIHQRYFLLDQDALEC